MNSDIHHDQMMIQGKEMPEWRRLSRPILAGIIRGFAATHGRQMTIHDMNGLQLHDAKHYLEVGREIANEQPVASAAPKRKKWAIAGAAVGIIGIAGLGIALLGGSDKPADNRTVSSAGAADSDTDSWGASSQTNVLSALTNTPSSTGTTPSPAPSSAPTISTPNRPRPSSPTARPTPSPAPSPAPAPTPTPTPSASQPIDPSPTPTPEPQPTPTPEPEPQPTPSPRPTPPPPAPTPVEPLVE